MIQALPHHGIEKQLIIHKFYNGLLYNARMTIDVAAGQALMNKPFVDAYTLIEIIAQNHYQWGRKCAHIEKT